MTVRLCAGTMTGTSIDSLDAALVRIEGRGLAMSARFVRGITRPLGALRSRLRSVAEQQPTTTGEIAGLSREFAMLHVDALRELLHSEAIDLVSVHGQTVYHNPPVSCQLMNPAVIAHALNIPVVSDLRGADLACDGQGAPITPLADWILYAGGEPVDIVNLGGFCNITHLPARAPASEAVSAVHQIRGRDLCVCNQLLDAISRETLGEPFDRDGESASRGTIDAEALDSLDRLLRRQTAAGRSLGTGDELRAWMAAHVRTLQPASLAATACEALGALIGAAAGAGRTILAGGGVRNRALAGAIRRHCTGEVVVSDALGIPSEFREAADFAILGALCQDRVPITLPQVTGVRTPPPISGTWTIP